MYIVQTVSKLAGDPNSTHFASIKTLGVFETIAEAHQEAIDHCQTGNLYHETINPDGEARCFPNCGTYEGKNWKKIAPAGYEATWSGQTVWVRIESTRRKR